MEDSKSAEEMLDIFDDQMRHVGTDTRRRAHTIGLLHQTFHCWIVRRANDRHTLLFQQRGPDVRHFPLYLDITSAGHITAGETVQESVRELQEELGVDVALSDLLNVGVRRLEYVSEEFVNREYCHTFLLNLDQELDRYTLQEEEIQALFEIDIEDVIALFLCKVHSVTANGAVLEDGKAAPRQISVNRSHFVPHGEEYYLDIARLGKGFLAGDEKLSLVDRIAFPLHEQLS